MNQINEQYYPFVEIIPYPILWEFICKRIAIR